MLKLRKSRDKGYPREGKEGGKGGGGGGNRPYS